jgi:hypothetical protein
MANVSGRKLCCFGRSLYVSDAACGSPRPLNRCLALIRARLILVISNYHSDFFHLIVPLFGCVHRSRPDASGPQTGTLLCCDLGDASE